MSRPTAADKKDSEVYDRAWEAELQKKHDGQEEKKRPRKLIFLADGTLCDATRPKDDGTSLVYADGTRRIYPRTTVSVLWTLPTDVYHFGKVVSQEHKDSTGTWYQEIHYQTGIGAKQETSWPANTFCFMTGQGIASRVMDGWAWISSRYRKGDEIYLVGFSRGSYITRSVGGMISRYGLLKPKAGQQLSNEDPDVQKMYENYKQKLTAETEPEPKVIPNTTGPGSVPIEAVICWDTVGALGVPNTGWLLPFKALEWITNWDYDHFHDTTLNNNYKNAFHVLSLTDHKAPFSACLWEKPKGVNTNLEQCWFPGQHEDVGGGLIEDHGIAFMTLAWLMDKLDKKLTFDEKYFDDQVNRLINWYLVRTGGVRQWGRGKTSDTQSEGINSLLVTKSDRTPGWYYRLNPENGCETSELLTNTNETIHRSVRERYGLPHLGANDYGPFNPYALSSWKLERNVQTNKWSWKWNGWTGTHDNIPEAELGVHWEKKLRGEAEWELPRDGPGQY